MKGAGRERGEKKRQILTDKREDEAVERQGEGDEGSRAGMGGGPAGRKFVSKCWPEEMGSGPEGCFFWLGPQRAPRLGEGDGREQTKEKRGGELGL